jgi:hypothetical protein
VFNFGSKSSKIKSLSQCIIEDFTYFVRDEVHKGRTEYLDTGINDDLMVYREFFMNILGISLGIEDSEPDVDTVVKKELISLVRRDLSYRRYKKLSESNRTLIYKTCELIFDKVVEGIIGGGLLEGR